jgi:hypothetical protein
MASTIAPPPVVHAETTTDVESEISDQRYQRLVDGFVKRLERHFPKSKIRRCFTWHNVRDAINNKKLIPFAVLDNVFDKTTGEMAHPTNCPLYHSETDQFVWVDEDYSLLLKPRASKVSTANVASTTTTTTKNSVVTAGKFVNTTMEEDVMGIPVHPNRFAPLATMSR